MVLRRLLALSLATIILASVGPARAAQEGAPAPEPKPSSPLRFAVVGDTGSGDRDQLAVARQMELAYQANPYSFVVMLGDNIYGGRCKALDRVFDIPYRTLLDKGVRFHATLGNHDQKCAAEELAHPKMGFEGRRYYSFAPAGDLVEFFTIDTTLMLENRLPEQLIWLERALAESKARWKIAFFHHPPYSPGSRHGDDAAIIAKLVPILKRGGVRVVMTGHEHFFAKIKERDGIDYIISGSGGKIHNAAINHRYPDLEAGNDAVHQFLTVTLSRDEMAFSVIGADGAVLYRGTIPHARRASAPAREAAAGNR